MKEAEITGPRHTNKKKYSQIQKKQIFKKIKLLVVKRGETMAHWAKDLAVTRGAVYHVVAGRSRSKRIMKYIEKRLGKKLWENEDDNVIEVIK